LVWPGFQTAFHRWIGLEILLHGSQATVLDRGAPLDDAGYRGGPTLGRLPKGVSHERARCLRGVPGLKEPPMPSTFGRAALKSEISADLDLPIGSRPSRVWPALCYSVKQSETKLCYRSRRDTGDRDLACRGADGVVRVRGGTLDDASWLQPTGRSLGSSSPRVMKSSRDEVGLVNRARSIALPEPLV
jgi:hypothetical protein